MNNYRFMYAFVWDSCGIETLGLNAELQDVYPASFIPLSLFLRAK